MHPCDRARPGVDAQARAGATEHLGVAAGEHGALGFGNVEGDAPLIPGGLVVGHVHRPVDLGFRSGELANQPVVRVVAIEAESGRLALEGSARIPVEAGGFWMGVSDLRADEERFGRIAHPCYPDGGMNGGANDGTRDGHGAGEP